MFAESLIVVSSSLQDCMEAADRDSQLSNRVSGILRSERFIQDQSQAYTVLNMQPTVGTDGSPVFETVCTLLDFALNSHIKSTEQKYLQLHCVRVLFIVFQLRIYCGPGICRHLPRFVIYCYNGWIC